MAVTVETIQVEIIGDHRRLRKALAEAKSAVERTRADLNKSSSTSAQKSISSPVDQPKPESSGVTAMMPAAILQPLSRIAFATAQTPILLDLVRSQIDTLHKSIIEIGNVFYESISRVVDACKMVEKAVQTEFDHIYALRAVKDTDQAIQNIGAEIGFILGKGDFREKLGRTSFDRLSGDLNPEGLEGSIAVQVGRALDKVANQLVQVQEKSAQSTSQSIEAMADRVENAVTGASSTLGEDVSSLIRAQLEQVEKQGETIVESAKALTHEASENIKKLTEETVKAIYSRFSELERAEAVIQMEGMKKVTGMSWARSGMRVPPEATKEDLEGLGIRNRGQYQQPEVIAEIVARIRKRQEEAQVAARVANEIVAAEQVIAETTRRTTEAIQERTNVQAESANTLEAVANEAEQQTNRLAASAGNAAASISRLGPVGRATAGVVAEGFVKLVPRVLAVAGAFAATKYAVSNLAPSMGLVAGLSVKAFAGLAAGKAAAASVSAAVASIIPPFAPIAAGALAAGTAIVSMIRGEKVLVALRNGLMAIPMAFMSVFNAANAVRGVFLQIYSAFKRMFKAGAYWQAEFFHVVTTPFRVLTSFYEMLFGKQKKFNSLLQSSTQIVEKFAASAQKLASTAGKATMFALEAPAEFSRLLSDDPLSSLASSNPMLSRFTSPKLEAFKMVFLYVKDAAYAARDLWKSMDAVGVTFRSAETDVVAFIDEMTTKYHASKKVIADTVTQFGLIYNVAGLSSQQMATLAKSLTQASMQMTSLMNIPVPVMMEKIRSGLVGQYEPLLSVGIVLNENRVALEAFRLGLAPLGGTLSETAKIMARTSLIMKGLSVASGHLDRNIDSNANKARALQGRLENRKASLGQMLQEIYHEFLALAHSAVAALEAMTERGGGILQKWLDGIASAMRTARVLVENFGLVKEYVFLRIQTTLSNAIKAITYWKDVIVTVISTVAQSLPEMIGSAFNNVITIAGNVMHNLYSLFTGGWSKILEQIKLIFNQLITFLDAKTGGLVTSVFGEGAVMRQEEIDAAQAKLSQELGLVGIFDNVDMTQIDKIKQAVADIPKPAYDDIPERAKEIADELAEKIANAKPAKAGDQEKTFPSLPPKPTEDQQQTGKSGSATLTGIEEFGQQLLTSLIDDPEHAERKKQSEYLRRMQDYQAEVVRIMRQQERRPEPATVS